MTTTRRITTPLRWYGGSPLHLLALIASFALAGYAVLRLVDDDPRGVAIWVVGAVVGHDLVLLPLYSVADRSVQAVLRHRAPARPPVGWVNYVRVPALLSGLALLVYFPLIFGLSDIYEGVTAMPESVYLGRWLLLSGVFFTVSAVVLALRLRSRRVPAAEWTS